MGSEGAGGGGGVSDLSRTPRVTPRTTKREASEDTGLTQARVHEASKGTFRNVRVKGNQESSEIPGKGAPPTACLGESGQQRRGWVHSTERPQGPSVGQAVLTWPGSVTQGFQERQEVKQRGWLCSLDRVSPRPDGRGSPMGIQ